MSPQPIRRSMKISEQGLDLIKHFEGCELEAYKCAAGVWTIGYGHIKTAVEGKTITQEEADNLLVEEIIEYEDYVRAAVKVPLQQHQFDALVSWTFNLGNGNLKRFNYAKSTKSRRIRGSTSANGKMEQSRW